MKLSLFAHALHSHCILTMFHAFRCVLVGLDWVLLMMQVIFHTSHIHAYLMHTYPFISLFLVMIMFLSLSLSLR